MDTSNPLLKRSSTFAPAFERGDAMTLQGVINKSGILLLLCIAAAAFSWMQPDLRPFLMLVGILGGLVACLVGTFKPATSPIAGPIYAVLEGLALGGISQLLEVRYPGLVANAMMLTFGVFGLMLLLYTTRTIRVTPGLVKAIFAATAAICLVYVVDLVLNMFGAAVPYLHQSGKVGIVISLVIVGIAAFNFLIDFAVIEQGVSNGAPRYMEWYSGMALLVTLVWLYLEILRLLAKLRSRD